MQLNVLNFQNVNHSKKVMKVRVLWRFGGSCVLPLSLFTAVAIAGVQRSAGQVSLGALAEPPTCTLATTFGEFVTCF